MTQTRSVTAQTDDGWTLAGDAFDPTGDPRAVVVLAHAMMATHTSMDRPAGAGLASTLVRRGFAVLSFDLRGHGKSRPTPREGGSYRYDDFVAHDIPALLAFARATHPKLHVGWIGHSLGAHTALVTSGLRPADAPDALVLLGANIWMPRLEPSRWRRAAKSAVLSSWLAASRQGYFDPRPFRLGNETVSRGFIEQFSRFWQRDRFASWDDGTDYLAALTGVRTSVLSIASDGDVLLAHPVCVARFVGHARNARLERRVVPHASHMGLVTDARSRPVWEQIADWLRARLGS